MSKRFGLVLFSMLTTGALGLLVHLLRRRIKQLEDELQSRETEERLAKELGINNLNTSPTAEPSADDMEFTMTEIGRLHAPFPQRAGCPRQGGILAPHIRSRLIFHPDIPIEVLDGITSYSHVWIVFRFHLNPRGKASSGRQGQTGKFTSTKIRPPRGNGIKVGVLATRAPHRPNPIGLSLGLIEKVEAITINERKRFCLVLRGLDLVDDTPVYDIKPYIPSDRVPSLDSISRKNSNRLEEKMKHVVTPSWVSAEDELARVEWTKAASSTLQEVCAANELAPLYDQNTEAMNAISEIVAQDPRALHDGRGKASKEDFYFTFATLRIAFRVETKKAVITAVQLDKGDLDAAPGSYPHNLALRRQAEVQANKHGLRLHWANPVREGNSEDLFDLKGGGRYYAEGNEDNFEDDDYEQI